jgi:hypothetical protein
MHAAGDGSITVDEARGFLEKGTRLTKLLIRLQQLLSFPRGGVGCVVILFA